MGVEGLPLPSGVQTLSCEAQKRKRKRRKKGSSAALTPNLGCDAQHPAADSSLGNSGNGDAWKDSFGPGAPSKSGSRRQNAEKRQFLKLQGVETEASLPP